MTTIRLGRGATSVEVKSDVEPMLREALSKATGGMLEDIERVVEELYTEGIRRWPVRSGDSKRGIQRGVRLVSEGDQQFLEGFIIGTEDYTYFVKSKKNGLGDKHAWTALFRKPLDAKLQPLVDKMRDRLAADINGVR